MTRARSSSWMREVHVDSSGTMASGSMPNAWRYPCPHQIRLVTTSQSQTASCVPREQSKALLARERRELGASTIAHVADVDRSSPPGRRVRAHLHPDPRRELELGVERRVELVGVSREEPRERGVRALDRLPVVGLEAPEQRAGSGVRELDASVLVEHDEAVSDRVERALETLREDTTLVHVDVGAEPPADAPLGIVQRGRAHRVPAIRAVAMTKSEVERASLAALACFAPRVERLREIVGVDRARPTVLEHLLRRQARRVEQRVVDELHRAIVPREPHEVWKRAANTRKRASASPHRGARESSCRGSVIGSFTA